MGLIVTALLISPCTAEDLEGKIVEDSSGRPLPSAGLRVHRAGFRELTAELETDAEGRFKASDLPAGDYTIAVSKPNFISASVRLRLPGAPVSLRLVKYGVIGGQATDLQ